jgi:superfamily II DNA or RNA helicase
MILRDYQENLVNETASQFRHHRKLCVQLATGGGKTIIFSAMSNRYVSKSKKSVLILVHRRELLLQTRKTLYNSFGIDSQLIVAGTKYIPPSPVYLGMVESVNRRLHKLDNVGFVIIDEAHIASFNKLHKVFEEQLVAGFTATPLSSNRKEPMNKYYEEIVCGPSIQQLISEGHLCQNITWAPKDIVDRSALIVERGEFDEGFMAQAFSKPKYIRNTIDAYEKWSKGKKTLIFNVNIAHNKEVCNAFNEAGYKARWLDSNMDDHERAGTLKWYSETPDGILCNVAIATTGFDEPSVECVIPNKAVMSMPFWIQMTGRGSRTTPVKNSFTIIDMGGNAITHGDWCDERDWRKIFYDPPKPSDGSGIPPVKDCPNCMAIVPASTRECFICGYKFPQKAVPIEEQLSNFVVVTKNIDLDAIIKENELIKDRYADFWKIGRQVAKKARETVAVMSDEYAKFVLQLYFDLAKEWVRKSNETEKRKIKFDKWHKDQAEIYLFKQLKKLYPEWNPQALVSSTTV